MTPRQQCFEHRPAIDPVVVVVRNAIDSLDGVDWAKRQHIGFAQGVPGWMRAGHERADFERAAGEGRAALIGCRRREVKGQAVGEDMPHAADTGPPAV